MNAVAPSRTQVRVTYNGTIHTLPYHPDEQVNALREQAVHSFGITANSHTLSIFNEAGQELADHSSIEAAGVRPGDLLVLRQSVVKGG